MAAGAAVVGLMGGTSAAVQMPPPQLLKDDRLTFVTATEANPWQIRPVFQPSFRWDMLNLNVDSASAMGRPIEGFGACFNELGWT